MHIYLILKIFWCKIQAPNKIVTYVVVFVCKQGNLILVYPPPPPRLNLGENSLQPQINVDIYFSYFGNVQKPSRSSAPLIFKLRNNQLIKGIRSKLKYALHTVCCHDGKQRNGVHHLNIVCFSTNYLKERFYIFIVLSSLVICYSNRTLHTILLRVCHATFTTSNYIN